MLRVLLLWALSLPLLAAAPSDNVAQQLFAASKSAVYRIDVINPATGRKSSLGTGFVFGDSQMLASNFHVISEKVHNPEQSRLEWLSIDGRRGPLTVVDIDVVHDLALLKAEQPLGIPFTTTAIPPKGAAIYSLGHPLGLDLAIVGGTANGLLEKALFDKIHFSGNLNPGMSGGPTLDANGQVVGVNVSTAGEAVSFLVPARYLDSLLTRAKARQFAPLTDFKVAIADQLKAHNARLLEEFLGSDWLVEPLGNARVPGEISPRINCWGEQHEAREQQPFRMLASLCRGDDEVFISDRHGAGLISYEFFWVDSAKLKGRSFTALYEQHFNSTFPSGADEEDVGNFSCSVRFVDIAGKPFKANVCARPYRDYPGMVDFMAVLALTGQPDQGLVMTLDLGMVTIDHGITLLGALLERISWLS